MAIMALISPNTDTGNLVGQAKTDAKSLQLQYQPSFWNDKSIKIDLK
ncbi:hypothetical protein LCAUCD174_1038 [Lacticaseibacillus paracasei]|nr:hypothetical protein LCAUCD174_1038 [Lacticaseibacillus paracasei]